MQPRKNKGIFTYLLIVIIAIICIYFVTTKLSGTAERVDYTTVIQYFDDYKVSYYELDLGTGELTYQLENEESKRKYNVPNVDIFLMDTKDYRKNYNEKHSEPLKQDYIKITDRTWIYSLIPVVLTVLLGIAILYFLMKQSGGGGKYTSFGKANLKAQSSARKATFKDVAGADEEKQELEEIVDFLKHPNKYTSIGAKVPKGVLLLGPPGTGKTLLARAVAGEAGCPFFPISGSDFVEMFVGVGASRVRDLFDQAKKHAPAIIFIDEIDAVGRHRGAGLGGGHDEREQTLNQLLVEMDGFEDNSGIVVLAATNRVDILDPAILRPGRFDRKIAVSPPDVKGREEILGVHSKNKPLAEDVDLKEIAKKTVGFTGADLENLLNESAIVAARAGRKFIVSEDIKKSFIKVAIGTEKKSRVISDEEKRLVAYHEAGHAILFHKLPDMGPVYMVSIIPTGGNGVGGYTMPLPEKDDMFESKTKMLHDIMVSLGGRIAEEIVLGDISVGAGSDIKKVTSVARKMVTRYGMSENLGAINYENEDSEVFIGRDLGHTKGYSEKTAAEIDDEVRRIVDDCYKKAKDILLENRDKLDACAELLLEKERISRDEFEALFE